MGSTPPTLDAAATDGADVSPTSSSKAENPVAPDDDTPPVLRAEPTDFADDAEPTFILMENLSSFVSIHLKSFLAF